jgi:hypothetical protein
MAGNSVAARSLDREPLASDGKATASAGKPDALQLLNDAINQSGVQRKVLATDCGLSESQFSRLTSGAQGFPIPLLDKLPDAIRADWLNRMESRDQQDVLALAAEQLTIAAVRWLRLVGGMRKRMAKAGL